MIPYCMPDPHYFVFFSKLLLCQTFLLGVNQMHVEVSLGAVFPGISGPIGAVL